MLCLSHRCFLCSADTEQALGASKRSREAQTLEKLGQFKSSLGAFLNSVQPLPKLSCNEFELSSSIATKADAGPSNAVISTGSLTENGLEKGFLTETLDDYDDRFGFAPFIHAFYTLHCRLQIIY